jgi:hypothetical protein
MIRLILGLLVVVLLGTGAMAQRPAAWDTRVRSSPQPQQPVEPQDQPTTPQPKDAAKKPLDTAGGKGSKPKSN